MLSLPWCVYLLHLHQAAAKAAQHYAPQELAIHVILGLALMATKGQAAPEIEQTYPRARTLCQQVGETPQLCPVLRGLCQFYRNHGALPTARELAEQLVYVAQREAAPTLQGQGNGNDSGMCLPA